MLKVFKVLMFCVYYAVLLTAIFVGFMGGDFALTVGAVFTLLLSGSLQFWGIKRVGNTIKTISVFLGKYVIALLVLAFFAVIFGVLYCISGALAMMLKFMWEALRDGIKTILDLQLETEEEMATKKHEEWQKRKVGQGGAPNQRRHGMQQELSVDQGLRFDKEYKPHGGKRETRQQTGRDGGRSGSNDNNIKREEI